jgi:hypothetical protein
MRVKLDDVRYSYLQVWESRMAKREGKAPRAEYSVTLLMKKDSPDHKKVEEAIQVAAVGEWGQKADGVLAALRPQGRVCFRDGDLELTQDGDQKDGYPGYMVLRCKSYENPFNVFNKQGVKITADNRDAFTSDETRPPRSGDYGKALVDIWTLDDDAKGGRRVCCSVLGIAFMRDGATLGRGSMSDDAMREEFGYEANEVRLEDMAS